MTTVIQTTLELIRRKLDEDLIKAGSRNDEWVVLSNIVDHEGNPYEGARDKVVMLLTNIQHETAIRNLPPASGLQNMVSPPLHVDLFVLFLANFQDENYPAGLGMISRTISFFQQSPVLTHDNLPGLDPAIDKLTVELQNLNLEELQSLMVMIGATYLPSVYYKMRMIPFEGEGADNVGTD